jgi:hypothetical protein
MIKPNYYLALLELLDSEITFYLYEKALSPLISYLLYNLITLRIPYIL